MEGAEGEVMHITNPDALAPTDMTFAPTDLDFAPTEEYEAPPLPEYPEAEPEPQPEPVSTAADSCGGCVYFAQANANP